MGYKTAIEQLELRAHCAHKNDWGACTATPAPRRPRCQQVCRRVKPKRCSPRRHFEALHSWVRRRPSQTQLGRGIVFPCGVDANVLRAVHRSRRFRARPPITGDQLAAGLLAAHATLADGLWHAPAGATAPDRYRLVAAALGDRDVSRSELIEALVQAGYARSSAVGRTLTTHPLITHVGPARYRLIEHTEPPQH